MSTTSFKDIFRNTPILFPIAGVFHLAAFIYTLYLYMSAPFPSIDWLQPLWLLCYTVAWLYCCFFNKWGAYGYLLLTAGNLILRFAIPDKGAAFANAMFPMDVLFSFFVFFYFKRFE